MSLDNISIRDLKEIDLSYQRIIDLFKKEIEDYQIKRNEIEAELNRRKQLEKTEICPICIEDIIEEEKHELICKHILHKKCYESFVKSPAFKKCPLCREDIFKDLNICQLCNKEMNINPDDCEVVKSICGCLFHYDCIKYLNDIYCVRCDRRIIRERVEALTYFRFETQHVKWIGPFLKCKFEGCCHNANPSYFGYCDNHREKKSTNKAIILSYVYFLKYIFEECEVKRANIFLKLIEYMNANHRLDDIEEVNFPKVKENIDKLKILDINYKCRNIYFLNKFQYLDIP